MAPRTAVDNRARVILAIGGPRGEALFEEALTGESSKHIVIAGVVADYPTNQACFAKGRYWRYPEFDPHRATLVQMVSADGLPMFLTSVTRGGFTKWVKACRPDAFLLAACAQRLRANQLKMVAGRALNIHPVAAGSSWKCERYKGPEPYEHMLEDNVDQAELVLHIVSSQFDRGKEIRRSAPVDLPKQRTNPGSVIYAMHRAMAPVTAELLRWVAPMLQQAARKDLRLREVLPNGAG